MIWLTSQTLQIVNRLHYLRTKKNRLKSVRIKLFSEHLQITNVFVEIRIVSRMIHELQNGQISNKHYLQWIIQSVIDVKNIQQNLSFSSPEMLSRIFFLCYTMQADWKPCSLLTNFILYGLPILAFCKLLLSLY